MSELANFHFIRPFCLLLVPIAVGLWCLLRKYNDPLRGWRSVMEKDLLEAMTVQQAGQRQWRDGLKLCAWLLAAVAVAGPTWRHEPSPFADDPVPIMLVLKAGETMQQADLTPSRMERARLKIVDFADQRKGQPLGLVAYAGSPHLVLPPTRDGSVVATMAAEIGPEIMPKPGDDLAAALNLAVNSFGETSGAIVVVADTVALSSEAQLSAFRAAHTTRVHLLGIARPGTPEEEDLQHAAKVLKAKLTLLTPDNADVVEIVRNVSAAPIAVGVDGEGTRWAEAGWWLVPILVIIALAGFRRQQPAVEKTP